MTRLNDGVVALRERAFAAVNGTEGIAVHERPDGIEQFTHLYAHPAANGRSAGAGLSDLCWYWLAPGPQVHQEHLEPGPRYDDVARCTRTILARLRRPEWDELVTRCTTDVLVGLPTGGRPAGRRLRDLAMPVWAAVYYELVFGEPCPDEARRLIVDNAADVVNALKCTRLRHMARRNALTAYLLRRLDDIPVELPATLTRQEQAWYLQGAFFNTAIVQMSEATAHLLLLLAEHDDVQQQLRERPDDGDIFDRVSDEAMRLYPLFGIAHRITTAPIDDVTPPLPTGSVLLFEYTAFQHAGVRDPERFDPDRFDAEFRRTHNFIPFGVSANRPCPARGVAPMGLAALTRTVLARHRFVSTVEHTRSLASRGPVLVCAADDRRPHRRRAARQRRLDQVQDVGRSVLQLVLGTVMVAHARRLALCRTFFRDHPDWRPEPASIAT